MVDWLEEIQTKFETPEEKRQRIAQEVLAGKKRRAGLEQVVELTTPEAIIEDPLIPGGLGAVAGELARTALGPKMEPGAAPTFGGQVVDVPEVPGALRGPAFAAAPPGVQPMGAGLAGLGGLGMPSFDPVRQAMQERGEILGQVGEAQALAAEEQREALAGLTTEQVGAAEREAELRQQNILAMETAEAGRQEREQERQQYIQGEVGKVQDALGEIQKSGIDPLNFYKQPDGSNNFGKSIAAAIAIGMGALAQSRMGGSNNALNIINRAIDRDIDAQKTNLANRRAGVGLQMNMLGRMQSIMDSERAAEQATSLMSTKIAQMKVEQAMAASRGPIAEQHGNVLMAALNNQVVEKGNQLVQTMANDRIQAEGAEYAQKEKAAIGRQKAAAARQAAIAKAGPPAMPPGMRIKDPARRMPEKEDFKRAKVMVGAQKNVNRLLNDLLKWRAEFGYEPIRGPALATANTKLQRVKSAMRKVDETGARLDAGELEMMGLDFEMGDFGMIKERLTTVRDSVNSKIMDALDPMNIELESAPTAGARRD
jgi:hypothetical protein